MGFISYLKHQIKHEAETRHSLSRIEELSKSNGRCGEDIVRDLMVYDLRKATLLSKENGVSEQSYCNEEIIVSLTSYGERIHDVYLAIESIMQGTMKPNRIVLWLAEEEFAGKRIPLTLQRQQQRGLEVNFCKDIRSFKKLVPTLLKYPKACAITIDDDAVYEYDFVERIVNTHIENPDVLCSCRMHRIRLDENKVPVSYVNWEMCVSDGMGTSLDFPTGGGGTLYPPESLDKEVLNEDVFMKLCPNADDIWFYAMALKKGTPIVKVKTPKPEGYYYSLPSSNVNPLSASNTNPDDCRNDVQLRAVFEYYDLYKKLRS